MPERAGIAVEGLRGFRRQWVGPDLIAGVTLAAVAIPEAMGYSRIAGMPVVTGIYTVVFPAAAFALLGSSRRLIVGADSATAALLFASLAGLATPQSGEYAALAALVALAVAAFLLLARIVRLGFLSDFLSRTALIGFLSGVGVQVAVSQLPGMLRLDGGTTTIGRLLTVARSLREVHAATAAIALAVVVAVLALERVSRRLPAALIALAATTALAALLHLDRFGVRTVGTLAGGFPPLVFPTLLPSLLVSAWPTLLKAAAGIFVVVLAQSSATSQSFALEHGEVCDHNRDLFGLAGANLAAAFTGTFPVNGSPTKTAVADEAGAQSQLTQLVAAATGLGVLLVATGLLRSMPEATLSAVVFTIGVRLVDGKQLRTLWQARKGELVIAVGTGAVVLLVGIESGIVFAVVVSLLAYIRQGYQPNDQLMAAASTPGGHLLARPAQPGLETLPGILVYRFDSALFFANADRFATRLTALVDAAPHPVTHVIVDMSPVADIDYTAGRMLLRLMDDLERRRVRLSLAHAEDVLPRLERDGILARLGEGRLFGGLRDALEAAMKERA